MKDTKILSQLDNYDWGEAFCYTHQCSPVLGSLVSSNSFDRSDVEEIIAISDGGNDGPNWIGLFKLKDNRYAFLTAGCDYTGWDCQASGYAMVGDNLSQMWNLALGTEDRDRLVETLPDRLKILI